MTSAWIAEHVKFDITQDPTLFVHTEELEKQEGKSNLAEKKHCDGKMAKKLDAVILELQGIRKALEKKKINLICLEDVLTKDEYAAFLIMLQNDWPQVFEAWMKNSAFLKKLSVGEK